MKRNLQNTLLSSYNESNYLKWINFRVDKISRFRDFENPILLQVLSVKIGLLL